MSLGKEQIPDLCQCNLFTFLGTVEYDIKTWSRNPRSTLTCYFDCNQKPKKKIRCTVTIAVLATPFLWVMKPYYSFAYLYWDHHPTTISTSSATTTITNATKTKSEYLCMQATNMQIKTVLMRRSRSKIICCRIYLGKFQNSYPINWHIHCGI